MRLICCPEIRRHPNYVAFDNLMRGPYLKRWELREVLKSESFKRFAALFPQSESIESSLQSTERTP